MVRALASITELVSSGRLVPQPPDAAALLAVLVAGRRDLEAAESNQVSYAPWSDVMRRANYAGALQYVPELSWILFLRILDEREEIEAEEAVALGIRFTPSLEAPFRWRDLSL